MASADGACYTEKMLRTTPSRIIMLLATGFALASTLPLWAQSRSIYGSGVDEAAVLVRLVNAGAPVETKLRIGALTLNASASGSSTPYRPTVADIYTLTFNGKRYEFMPEPGGYYSIVITAKSLTWFPDHKHLDPAKTQLYFYNVTATKDLELKTADGATKVLGPCDPASSAQVAVNPVQVQFAVYSGSKKLGPDIAPKLERGASFSFFAFEHPTGIQAFLIKATVSAE